MLNTRRKTTPFRYLHAVFMNGPAQMDELSQDKCASDTPPRSIHLRNTRWNPKMEPTAEPASGGAAAEAGADAPSLWQKAAKAVAGAADAIKSAIPQQADGLTSHHTCPNLGEAHGFAVSTQLPWL